MGCESLTYEERRAIGWGTVKERLGKDSIKDWDSCALCLHPVQDPVCTPEGVLYEKETILECLLQQKKDIAKRVALWEQQEQDDKLTEERRKAAEEQAKLADFHRLNHGAGKYEDPTLAAAMASVSGTGAGAGAKSGALAVQATDFAKKQLGEMKAFWLPYKTPEAENKKEKPDTDTKCPQTGKKLRLKDLIPVKFTKVPHSDDANRKERFMCPLCNETFTNISQVVVLRPTGDAIGEECYKKLVEPDGNYNGTKVRPKDVIKLERGGTGFSLTQAKAQAEKFEHVGLGSGLADSRGQHRNATSKFGLRFS